MPFFFDLDWLSNLGALSFGVCLFALTAVLQNNNSNRGEAGAAPRRRGSRHREDRGLPADEALKSLATTFLESQHRLWPELAAKGELPPAAEEHVDQLVNDFKDRFLAREEQQARQDAVATMPFPLAASYLRYSDEGSNPRSLAQQLRLQLDRARQNGHFIPWAHVYADAAITGTIANRRGYQMAKQAIRQGGDGFACLYIDEIGRASRDAIESLRLGRLVEQCRKRLIGVSDGFDSDTPHAKMMLSLFAMLHEWFIDQLRSKVNRGMDDAFRQGKNIQPPSVGYKLVPAQDQHGNPVYDNDGEPVMAKVVDEDTADYVREAFVLYGEKGWSGGRIARYFNEAKVQGKVTWDGSRIRELLTRATYVGVEYYRMTRQERDPETGSVKTIKKPKKEWLKRESPHLRIISDDLWEKVQHRRKECADAFTDHGKGDKSRTEMYPTTLVRPVCGCCGKELMLGRSGQYGSFCCLNGIHGKHGCTYKGYKSVRIVETVVLDHLRQEVFTEARLARLLKKANRYLAKEAKRPRKNLGPLKKQIKAEEGKRDRLVAILTQEGEEDLGAVVKAVRQHERRLKELRRQLKEATARNVPPPPPMEKADMAMLLDDLRGLLNQDIAAAAPVLRELLGPVVVRQEKELGKTRPTWHAEFTVNLVPVLVKLTAKRNCPTAGTWEFLNTRDWTIDEKCDVLLETVPAHVRLAAESARLRAQGASVESIARALKTSWETVRAALKYAETGTMTPQKKSGKKNRGPRRRFPKYIEIAANVVRRRDIELQTFTQIARDLRACPRARSLAPGITVTRRTFAQPLSADGRRVVVQQRFPAGRKTARRPTRSRWRWARGTNYHPYHPRDFPAPGDWARPSSSATRRHHTGRSPTARRAQRSAAFLAIALMAGTLSRTLAVLQAPPDAFRAWILVPLSLRFPTPLRIVLETARA